jgi:SAM-dependent methyltransferase
MLVDAAGGTRRSSERLMQIQGGFRASALLAAGATHRIFTHIEDGARTAEEISARAGISLRGAVALLDGLTGLGVIERSLGRYTNAADTSQFLVEGKPSSMTGFARLALADMPDFAQLAEVARTGQPLAAPPPSDDDPSWIDLVSAIAPLARPAALAIARHLRVAEARRPSILDVGGGSGMYTLVCLGESPEATGVQIDWPSVNRVARRLAEGLGLADRFRTVDGDLRTASFGEGAHDVVIYAHVAHLLSPAENVAVLSRIRRALRPGGRLAVSDFILDEDRHGKSFAGMFHTNMLLHTREGAVWREADYRAWLGEAGFVDVTFVDTETPATLVFAG